MKAFSISGSLRANVGKKDANALRRAGNIPCVIYGGKQQIGFYAPVNSFTKLVYSPDVQTVNISVDGKTYNTKIQEIQVHPVSDKIMHIDFVELFDDKPAIMDIPVKLIGSSAGVKAGGKLVTNLRKLKVKALPKHLPDTIDINVEQLEIGKSIRIGDLNVQGLKFMDAPNVVITTVQSTRNTVAAAGEEAKTGAAAAAAKAPAKK
jgi:large subunit ribosomal protein L25